MRLYPTVGFVALLLCLSPHYVYAYDWAAEDYTELTIHNLVDGQAVVSDCYPYLNPTHNANCNLRSAWHSLAQLLPYQPATLLLPEAALLVIDGVLEMASFNVTIEGGGSTVWGDGGFIYSNTSNSSSSLTLHNITLTGFGSDYGVVHLSHLDAHLSHVTFTNNTASGIHATNTSLRVEQCSFLNSSAPRGAGAHLTSVTGAFSDCLFDSLGAEWGGALYIQDSANVSVSASFSNCNASRGGAVYLEHTRDVDFAACTFTNNTAVSDGGAVCARHSNDRASFSNSTFAHNRAGTTSVQGYGGSLYLDDFNNDLALTDVLFRHSTATQNGGSVYLRSDNHRPRLQRVTFEDSTAHKWGGSLHLSRLNDDITLTDVLFLRSSAVKHGGGMYIYSANNNTHLSNVTFDHCTGEKGNLYPAPYILTV